MSRVDRILEAIDTGLQTDAPGSRGFGYDIEEHCWRCLNKITPGGRACDECVAWMSCETDVDPVDEVRTITSLSDIISTGPLEWGSLRTNRSHWQNYITQSSAYEEAMRREYTILRDSLLMQLYPTPPTDFTNITEV
jgi:hypothetical protein